MSDAQPTSEWPDKFISHPLYAVIRSASHRHVIELQTSVPVSWASPQQITIPVASYETHPTGADSVYGLIKLLGFANTNFGTPDTLMDWRYQGYHEQHHIWTHLMIGEPPPQLVIIDEPPNQID